MRRFKRVVMLLVLSIGVVVAGALVYGHGKEKHDKKAHDARPREEKMAFSKRDTADQLAQVRAEIIEVKEKLTKTGEYACCVEKPATKQGCDFCLLSHGSCPCMDSLSDGKPVCVECKYHWGQGNGVAEGVDAEDVKVDMGGGGGHHEKKEQDSHGEKGHH